MTCITFRSTQPTHSHGYFLTKERVKMKKKKKSKKTGRFAAVIKKKKLTFLKFYEVGS